MSVAAVTHGGSSTGLWRAGRTCRARAVRKEPAARGARAHGRPSRRSAAFDATGAMPSSSAGRGLSERTSPRASPSIDATSASTDDLRGRGLALECPLDFDLRRPAPSVRHSVRGETSSMQSSACAPRLTPSQGRPSTSAGLRERTRSTCSSSSTYPKAERSAAAGRIRAGTRRRPAVVRPPARAAFARPPAGSRASATLMPRVGQPDALGVSARSSIGPFFMPACRATDSRTRDELDRDVSGSR